MKLLLLLGNFPKGDDLKIVNNSKKNVQFAANTFQWNLIKGFKKKLAQDLYMISAPFINPYPMGYKRLIFFGKTPNKNEKYISFFNFFGVRNISRYIHLKKNARKFLDIHDNEKYIIVYSPHVPLLKTAYYLKKRDSSIKIILLLPDLPQFVSLSENMNILYKILKPLDIKKFYKYSKKFDKYILLTKQMNSMVNNENKPYLVVEGIVDQCISRKKYSNDKTIITYTGTLDKKYGIYKLLDAFMMINDKNCILKICGRGDSESYIDYCQKKDNRIQFLGQLSASEAKKIQNESNILVNPRQSVEEFTKYSFPSKNLEYLSTGKPVIAYKLDGIPDEYDDVLFYPKDNSTKSLMKMMVFCSKLSFDELDKYSKKTKKFLIKKNISNTTTRILNFIRDTKGE